MGKDYWFKGELRFTCPFCQQVSSETLLACSENVYDPHGVATKVQQHFKPVVCQLCKKVCPDKVQIQFFLHELSPEELASLPIGSAPSSKRVM